MKKNKKNIKKNAKKKITNKKTLNWKLIKKIALVVVILLCTVLAVWNSWANTAPVLNTITIHEKELPSGFDGFRIAHISDFHSAGRMTDKVIKLLQEAKPDIICITGDLVDSRDDSVETALELAKQAMEIAPCYFVAGNHEMLVSDKMHDALLEGLADRGVVLLMDQEELLQRDDSEIALVGNFWGETEQIPYLSDNWGYRILLSHFPEPFKVYAAAEYDLVLTGHAHGGQFRLPFIGGIYAPGQGLFPKYDAGVFSQGCTDMVVSRGIGNSTIPFRFNNRPEVVVIVLECQ